jgi:hypothetical protein
MPIERRRWSGNMRGTASDRSNDQKATIEMKTRLARGGFDQIDINAEVIVQARELN